MKLLIAYAKGNKNLLKIGFDDGTEKWATTSATVLEYAKTNFKNGDEAKFEMTNKNGQYFVTKIIKLDGSSSGAYTSTSPTASSTVSEFKCSICGKTLKDGKHKKCFTCNQKSPEPVKSSSEEGERRNKLGVLSASAQAVATAMQGQIGDAGALADMILVVYERLYKKIVE